MSVQIMFVSCMHDGVFNLCTGTGRLDLPHKRYSRMAYIIADLRYVLRNRPETWSPSMRTNFIESFQVFLNVLDLIQVRLYVFLSMCIVCKQCNISIVLHCLILQGIEPVVRQHVHHIPIEPEWETLFNLCIMLVEAIELFVEWCHSDVSA